ncbi:uncharacterized protein RCC_02267 [Ramularia collo-cygni]|uniref:Uncharacterized protein n=1 Tax=Ramularia collo-cygni TaxID=112498 RepID=A0A2D3V1T6_9PEZI|nr:uncharacterized protein RCC_02267 [Ramularia collo-cygni]CZT16424.1 uncharacterized protein RCC_02267 [Ramularia collo-cygni]
MSSQPSDPYCVFGYDFRLKKDPMKALLTTLGVPFLSNDTKDVLRAKLEKYYGLEVMRQGKFPLDVCFELDPREYSESELRMLLSTSDIKYDDLADHGTLADIVSHNITTIRRQVQRAFNQNPGNHLLADLFMTDAMNDLTEGVQNMSAFDRGPSSATPSPPSLPVHSGVLWPKASSAPARKKYSRTSSPSAPSHQQISHTSAPFIHPEQTNPVRSSQFDQPVGASTRASSLHGDRSQHGSPSEVKVRTSSPFDRHSQQASPDLSSPFDQPLSSQFPECASDSSPGPQIRRYAGSQISTPSRSLNARSPSQSKITPELVKLIENGYITIIQKLQRGDFVGAVTASYDRADELSRSVKEWAS